MWIFSYYSHYYKISKISLCDLYHSVLGNIPPPPLNEGLTLKKCRFWPTSSTYQRHLKLGQRLEIDMVVQSLKILEKSGNKILVRENLENLEKSGNYTERAKNVIGNNAFSY